MAKVFECKGVELGKRTYTDAEITQNCPNTKCKNVVTWDGSCQYLSYPVTGEDEKIYMYCEECGEEWQLKARLDMTLTVEV